MTKPDGTDPIALLEDLVRIPSVNPSVAPDEATGEGAIAEFIRDWLRKHGVRAELEEVAPGRPNVVGTIGRGASHPASPGKTLVFCGHIDVVGTAGMTIPPLEPRRDGNRLYGRGAQDMKAGVAAAMAAGVRLHQEWTASPNGAPGTVLLALVADEEYTSLGADHFVAHHRGDACILTEPSDGDLIIAHKGFVWLTLRTRGRATHGSRWDLGKSAIGDMGRLVAALERFDLETLRKRVDPIVGPASMHCALIQGGVGISTYAPECALQVERRTLPGETPEQVQQELTEVARGAGVEAEITIDFARDPFRSDPNDAILRATREAARAITGKPAKERGAWYWMDSAIFAAAGIPTVNYGHAGDGEHEAVEWAEIDTVIRTTDVLVEAAKRYFSEA